MVQRALKLAKKLTWGSKWVQGVRESGELFGQNKEPWIQTNNNPSLFRNAKAGSRGK